LIIRGKRFNISKRKKPIKSKNDIYEGKWNQISKIYIFWKKVNFIEKLIQLLEKEPNGN
jgi:hypothetical protein